MFYFHRFWRYIALTYIILIYYTSYYVRPRKYNIDNSQNGAYDIEMLYEFRYEKNPTIHYEAM